MEKEKINERGKDEERENKCVRKGWRKRKWVRKGWRIERNDWIKDGESERK